MALIPFARSIFVFFFCCLLAACGGGGSDDSPSKAINTLTPVTKNYSVTVIDGYLKFADVWLDLNDNGQKDSTEPSANSGQNGTAVFTLSLDIDPAQHPVLVHAKAGITFDESLNRYISQDFFLATPAGKAIVTPFSTLVYLRIKQGYSLSSATLYVANTTLVAPELLLTDFIQTQHAKQSAIAEDLVRLQVMPSSQTELSGMIAQNINIFDEVIIYAQLSNTDNYIVRNLSGLLDIDTDRDEIADSDDADIDGDNVFNYQDAFPFDITEWEDLDNDGIGNNSDGDIDGDGILNKDDNAPLIAEFNTALNPGLLTLTEAVQGNIDENAWQYFIVESPEEKTLNITLSNLSEDVDLYIKKDGLPTQFDYDCRSNESSNQLETCLTRVHESATYYIGIFARQGSNFDLLAIAQEVVINKVMLLLHGLASDPSTWDAMVNDDSFFNGSCQILTADIPPTANPVINKDGISCFNLEFGSNDRGTPYSAAGLDNKICNRSPSCEGDYTTFEGLSNEVESAVQNIINVLGTDTEIYLFGHSRGGLAGRAYLQNISAKAKEFVKGLATIGTPHQGSPLGRFYQYMDANCIPKSVYRQDGSMCEDNWEVIEMIAGERLFFGVNYSSKYKMDLHAPSINDLSPESPAITTLNNDLSALGELTIGSITYQGTPFGILNRNDGLAALTSKFYDLYDYGYFAAGDHPHPNTLRYMEKGQTRESYFGDGIVPAYSQNFNTLLTEHGISVTKSGVQKEANVLHTEQTSRVTDIYWLFDELYSTLGWR